MQEKTLQKLKNGFHVYLFCPVVSPPLFILHIPTTRPFPRQANVFTLKNMTAVADNSCVYQHLFSTIAGKILIHLHHVCTFGTASPVTI